MYILKILFIVLLILFPFGELIRFDIGNDIRFKPIDILTGIIFVYWLILSIIKQKKDFKNSWIYILFPLVCLLSLILNSSWLLSLQFLASAFYLIRWVSYLSLYFITMQFEEKFRKTILLLMVIDGFVVMLLGFVQYIFFSSLKPLYHLGWDEHMYRMFSVFLDPNYTGGFFVLYLLFMAGFVYKYTQKTSQKIVHIPSVKGYTIPRKKFIVIVNVIILLSLISVFLTFSRSALLMLIVGVSVFFLLIGRKKLILLFLSIIAVFILVISSYFYVESMNLFRQASTNARIGNYQSAIKIITDQPILGIGFNTYRYAKEKYDIHSGWVKAPSHADAGVDNSFLFVIVTSGIIGLLAYLLMWGISLKRAYVLYKKNSNIFAIIFISSSAGLFVHAMFINSLFFPAIMLWMWILLGLMEKKTH